MLTVKGKPPGSKALINAEAQFVNAEMSSVVVLTDIKIENYEDIFGFGCIFCCQGNQPQLATPKEFPVEVVLRLINYIG